MLSAVENVNQEERVRISMISRYSPIAPLYSLRKDHKTNFDPSSGPPGRPVCGATGGLNEKFSYLLSTILDKIWQDVKHETVCISTEEILSAIDEFNFQCEENGEQRQVVVGSADVKALYPSLRIDFTVKIVSEMFEESDIMIEGIDYEEMGFIWPTTEVLRNWMTQVSENAALRGYTTYNHLKYRVQG